eukprot:41893-Chlamydomonas_euryale.AAC.1
MGGGALTGGGRARAWQARIGMPLREAGRSGAEGVKCEAWGRGRLSVRFGVSFSDAGCVEG